MRAADLLGEALHLPEHEARRLLLLALDSDATALVSNPDLPDEVMRRFRRSVERRTRGEPLQYIEGTVDFGPLRLGSDRRALIPRPETEQLWELVTTLAGGFDAIVDLCTGSGNLALALKATFDNATVLATDTSPDALSLARESASELGLAVNFLEGDLFAPLPIGLRRSVDLIVSNPPYVALGDWDSLPLEVRDHEPREALVAGEDGLEVIRRIADEAGDWLRPGGLLICEIGETQGEACRRLFAGYSPDICTDLAGKDRFVIGRAPMQVDLH